MEEESKLKWWHGLLFFILCMLILFFGGGVLVTLFGKTGGYMVSLLFALIALLITFLSGERVTRIVPMKLPPIRQAVGALGMLIGTKMLSSAIGVFLVRIIPNYADRNQQISTYVSELSPFLAILVIAVLPAICEEIACRGFMGACFGSLKNDKLTILFTALMFGALHGDLYAFFATSLVGALFAYLMLRTGSLLLPMLLHFLNNAYSVVMVYLMSHNEKVYEAINVAGDFSTMPLTKTVFLSLFYLGIAVSFLYFSYCLFEKRSVFNKKGLIVLIVSALLYTVGNFGVAFASVRYHTLWSESCTVGEVREEVYTFEIEKEGRYQLALEGRSEDAFAVLLLYEDEEVLKKEGTSTVSVQKTLTLSPGSYSLCLIGDEDEETTDGKEERTVTVTLVIIEYV